MAQIDVNAVSSNHAVQFLYWLSFLVRRALGSCVYALLWIFRKTLLSDLREEIADSNSPTPPNERYNFDLVLVSHQFKFRLFRRFFWLSKFLEGVGRASESFGQLLAANGGWILFAYTESKTVFSYEVEAGVSDNGGRWVDFGWVTTHTKVGKFKIVGRTVLDKVGAQAVIGCVWLSGEKSGTYFEIKQNASSLDEIPEFIKSDLNVYLPPSALEIFADLGVLAVVGRLVVEVVKSLLPTPFLG